MVVHVPYHSSQYEIVAFVILLKYLCFGRSSDDLFLLYNKIAIIYIVIFFFYYESNDTKKNHNWGYKMNQMPQFFFIDAWSKD